MTIFDVRHHFGTAVRNQRTELRFSQEELDRAGLHRTYISDIERGARNPSLEIIAKLAHALKLSLAGLFARASQETGQDELIEILLIEDNRDDVELTLRAFRQARITNPVHIAHDGVEALDFLFAEGRHDHRRNRPLPGVILLDLFMPKIGGLEVLRRIKADPRTRRIPVIVLTGSTHDRDIAACRSLGVESYLVKPVGFQNFAELMPQMHFDWALMKRSVKEPA